MSVSSVIYFMVFILVLILGAIYTKWKKKRDDKIAAERRVREEAEERIRAEERRIAEEARKEAERIRWASLTP